ncbi:MAG: EAL domain-containing protein [Gammaproteobacteria bacterium]|nr:EAL domain-containing protein [Gammaproteobacteria bacterium]
MIRTINVRSRLIALSALAAALLLGASIQAWQLLAGPVPAGAPADPPAADEFPRAAGETLDLYRDVLAAAMASAPSASGLPAPELRGKLDELARQLLISLDTAAGREPAAQARAALAEIDAGLLSLAGHRRMAQQAQTALRQTQRELRPAPPGAARPSARPPPSAGPRAPAAAVADAAVPAADGGDDAARALDRRLTRLLDERDAAERSAQAVWRSLAALTAAVHGAVERAQRERIAGASAGRAALNERLLHWEDAARRSLALVLTAAAALLASVWVLHSVIAPLRQTATALRELKSGEGRILPPEVHGDEFGEMAAAIHALRDSTRHLNYLAYYDAATALPNRAAFERAVAAALRDGDGGRSPAVLMVGLDRFRTINASFGHLFGDRYLHAAANRLQEHLRPPHLVSRHGGAVFACLLRLPAAPQARAELHALARRLLDGMNAPLAVEGQELGMAVSIGAALPDPGLDDADALIAAADGALHLARRTSEGQALHVAEGSAAQRLRSALELAADIHRGIGMDEFVPHYLPVVDVSDGRAVAVEALLRWQHPRRGLLLPGDFLAVAEDSGRFVAIAEEALRKACATVAGLRRAGHALRLVYNVSAYELREGFAARLLEMLDRAGLPPDALEVDIAESAMLENPDQAEHAAQRLHAAGAAVCLDDFVMGHSPQPRLHGLPIARIKIARALVAQIGESRRAERAVAAIVRLAGQRGWSPIAQGVETRAQSQRLAEMGCRHQQGFYFTPALPPADLEAWLARAAAGTRDPAPGPHAAAGPVTSNSPAIRNSYRSGSPRA